MDSTISYKGYRRGDSAQGAYDFYRNNGDTTQDMYDYSPYLREIAQGNILEIGTAYGISTASFLCGVEERGGHVYTVDVDAYCGELYPGHPQLTFIQANSVTQPETIKQAIPQSLDVLFIDGDHHYESITSDLENFYPLLRSGGLIVLHDVDPCPAVVPHITVHDPWEPARAMNDFVLAHPTWSLEIKKGRYGLGVIVRG
jgi:predicted O-methyltransferase YrrM